MSKLLFTALLALCAPAWAAPDEAEAVRLALARHALTELEYAGLAAAQADVRAATLPANPTIAWSRERSGGAAALYEDVWQISQSVDFSGRRALQGAAAERLVDVAHSANRARRVEIAGETRRRYYELLFRRENVRVTEEWLARFARIEITVARLARAGEASGHDLRRLGRERHAGEARLAAEQADLARVGERLAALTGVAEAGAPGDTLTPPPLPDVAMSAAALESRPDLVLLAQRADAADLEERAAARGWIPEITLGVGVKRSVAAGVSDSAALLGVSLPLPLFDRRQAREQRAAAEARAARAEYALARSRALGELRGLHRQSAQLRAAALAYRRAAPAATPELLRIAEAAYRGGESTLLELLDAYRGALDAETTALALEWKAREARIDYDQLSGRSEP